MNSLSEGNPLPIRLVACKALVKYVKKIDVSNMNDYSA